MNQDQPAKDRTAKTACEMTFNEFVAWAAGYILFGIGEGAQLRNLVGLVVDHAARNEVFGGQKKIEPPASELAELRAAFTGLSDKAYSELVRRVRNVEVDTDYDGEECGVDSVSGTLENVIGYFETLRPVK